MDRTKAVFGLLGWVLMTFTVGLIGARATIAAIPGWYVHLHHPALSPPSWVFSPVWTVLYLMMALAMWLVWLQEGDSRAGRAAASAYMGQLALNGLWPVVFFGGQSLAGGLVVIALLWVAIVATLVVFWRQRPVAGVLLIPYLAWVTFASVLNWQLWMLNR
jgi:translocator protein